MKNIIVFFFLLTINSGVIAQQKSKEQLINKGVSRFYKFNVLVDDKLYFLSSARYDGDLKIFYGTISRVDSSKSAPQYILQHKEIQLVVDSLDVNSVFITIELKLIKEVRISEY